MTSVNCRKIEKLLPLYLDGDLPDETSERGVFSHLRACNGCRKLADEYRLSQSWLRLHTPPEVDNVYYDQIRAAVLEDIARDRKTKWSIFTPVNVPSLYRQLIFAASLALLVFSGALALYLHDNRLENDDPQNLTAAILADNPDNVLTAGWKKRIYEDEKPTPESARAAAAKEAKPAFNRRRMSVARWRKTLKRRPESNAVFDPGNERDNSSATTVASLQPAVISGASSQQPLRIEIQTGDPNIRIIWLSPNTTDRDSTQHIENK